MTRNKPRPSASRLQDKVPAYKSVEIDNPTKLPEHYLVVGDNWIDRVEQWDTKLRARHRVQIKRPLTLYVLTRVVGAKKEMCLECESIEKDAPAGVVTGRASYRTLDKAQRTLLRQARQEATA